MNGLEKKRAGLEAVAVNGGGAAVAGMILEGPSSRIVPRKPRRVKTDHNIRVFGRPEDPPEIALPLPPRPECGVPGDNFWEDAARDPSLLQMLRDPEQGRRILEERKRGEIPGEIPSEKTSQNGLTRPSRQVYNQIKKTDGGQSQMNTNETTTTKVYDGTFTIAGPNGHRTAKISTVRSGSLEGKRILSLMTGRDNENSFTGIAFVNEDSLGIWRRFQDTESERIARFFFRVLSGVQILPEGYDMEESRACYRCDRKLTNPDSLESGIGPECAKK